MRLYYVERPFLHDQSGKNLVFYTVFLIAAVQKPDFFIIKTSISDRMKQCSGLFTLSDSLCYQ